MSVPDLSHTQDAALRRLKRTGNLKGVRAPTLKVLFDLECVMEDAFQRLILTDTGEAYLTAKYPEKYPVEKHGQNV
jgi:hypothetical protein